MRRRLHGNEHLLCRAAGRGVGRGDHLPWSWRARAGSTRARRFDGTRAGEARRQEERVLLDGAHEQIEPRTSGLGCVDAEVGLRHHRERAEHLGDGDCRDGAQHDEERDQHEHGRLTALVAGALVAGALVADAPAGGSILGYGPAHSVSGSRHHSSPERFGRFTASAIVVAGADPGPLAPRTRFALTERDTYT
jgi:hypothetical protein